MLPDMLARTKMIYKGDVLSGSFYLLIGTIAALSALGLHLFTGRLGYYYLSIALAVFAVYMLGKGGVMMYMYWSRYKYYKTQQSLSDQDIKEELVYTEFRIAKKKKSRRIYMYIILIGCFIAFAGIFHQEKGLIIGTCIPIVLLSAIEFSIGLLSEFRLSEFQKQLSL